MHVGNAQLGTFVGQKRRKVGRTVAETEAEEGGNRVVLPVLIGNDLIRVRSSAWSAHENECPEGGEELVGHTPMGSIRHRNGGVPEHWKRVGTHPMAQIGGKFGQNHLAK